MGRERRGREGTEKEEKKEKRKKRGKLKVQNWTINKLKKKRFIELNGIEWNSPPKTSYGECLTFSIHMLKS